MTGSLLLARHGRTVSNARGLLLGRANPDLDELGRSQAQALGQALAASDEPIARIVTSPLRRTAQTAEAVAAHTRAEVVVDDRWIELDYGEFDERPVADLGPAIWQEWRANIDFRPPGGETLVELGQRVRVACEALSAQAEESATVVVSHVSPIKAATAWALGVPDEVAWRMFLTPASLTTVRLNGDGSATLVGFNATDHLS